MLAKHPALQEHALSFCRTCRHTNGMPTAATMHRTVNSLANWKVTFPGGCIFNMYSQYAVQVFQNSKIDELVQQVIGNDYQDSCCMLPLIPLTPSMHTYCCQEAPHTINCCG